jgi:hypothetical protein
MQLPFLPQMLYALPISSPWFHQPNIWRGVQIIEVSLRIFSSLLLLPSSWKKKYKGDGQQKRNT